MTIKMFSNTRLLTTASLLTIFVGLILLLSGIYPGTKIITKVETAVVQTGPEISTQNATSSAETAGIVGERVTVVKVVDGDTIVLGSGQTVRLIGIDTPETVDPRRPVGCFGKQASNETKKLLLGKEVILQKDVSDTDKYKRLLRYIFLPLKEGQTLFINDFLIRQGFAKVLTYPPDVKFNEQFREAEAYARENNLGLWGSCK